MYRNQNERLNEAHRIFRSFLFPPSCCQDFSSLSRNCRELLWDDRIFVRYEPVKRQNFHALAAATTSQARRNQPGFPIHQTTLTPHNDDLSNQTWKSIAKASLKDTIRILPMKYPQRPSSTTMWNAGIILITVVAAIMAIVRR